MKSINLPQNFADGNETNCVDWLFHLELRITWAYTFTLFTVLDTLRNSFKLPVQYLNSINRFPYNVGFQVLLALFKWDLTEIMMMWVVFMF